MLEPMPLRSLRPAKVASVTVIGEHLYLREETLVLPVSRG